MADQTAPQGTDADKQPVEVTDANQLVTDADQSQSTDRDEILHHDALEDNNPPQVPDPAPLQVTTQPVSRPQERATIKVDKNSSKQFVIVTNGLVAARYLTLAEAKSNLHRFNV